MAKQKNKTLSDKDLNKSNGGFIERHRGCRNNKIIDDVTGDVLGEEYWYGDAVKKAEQLGVSTDSIDEETTDSIRRKYLKRATEEAYQRGVSAGKGTKGRTVIID